MDNMDNIFEGAKFGDRFLTRDGRTAIYQAYDTIRQGHCIFLENGHTMCFDNGKNALNTQRFDIVSRCQEPIDEKKLDELAEKYCISEFAMTHDESTESAIAYKAYQTGYRSAFDNKPMEE